MMPHASYPDDSRKSEARGMTKFFEIIHILFSLEIGLVLLWLPWQNIWGNNLILYLWPRLEPVVSSFFFKGAVVGLGIDSILLGIYGIVHIKSAPKTLSS